MAETPSRKEEMRKEANRIHESAMHSAQNQFEYSKTWRSVDRWLGGSAALVGGIAGASGLAKVLPVEAVGLIALISAAVGSIATFLEAPKAKLRAHHAANAYLALQQDARIFTKIDLDHLDEDKAREMLSGLAARLQELNATAEIPSAKARKRAKKNIENGYQNYEVDK